MIGITAGLQSAALGQLGGHWIDDTTAYTGDWCAITAINDTTFTLLSTTTFRVNSGAINGSLAGKTLPKGMTLYGRFSAITIGVGGAVVAYRATAE